MNRNLLVVKANSLIEASYRLELYEQRLILLATTKERTRRGTPGELEGMIIVTAVEYANVFGIPVNQAYEDIKKAVTTLFERKVTLHVDRDKKPLKDGIAIHWIISQGIRKDVAPEQGLIKLRFHPELEPYLDVIGGKFTRYYLENITKMTSIHAIKLYELLLDWGQDFKFSSKEVSLIEIRNLLTGEAAYDDIKDFKKYVLDIACKQINEFSDIECSYDNKRTGRTITHIIFFFSRKPEYEKKQITHDATQSTPKRKSKKNISTEVEIVPIAPPHENKALQDFILQQKAVQL